VTLSLAPMRGPLRAARLRPKHTWSPIKGSSARVSTIRSPIVVRQRFFWIPAPTPTSSQHNTSGRASWKRLGPVVTMRSRSLGRRVSECWL
jgi:hypothetical protein